MTKTHRSSALEIVLLALAFVVGASLAGAQVSVRSSRQDTASVLPGAIITTPFSVVNRSKDSVQTTPVVTLPAGWTTVNSMAPASVAANGMELWLLSVSAPEAAPAGSYVIRAGIKSGNTTAMDSAIVTIAERHELEIRAVNPPTFVLSGESYEAAFVVRNRGNVATKVSLKATANHGMKPVLSATQLSIEGGASSTIVAKVAISADVSHSMQDVLEVLAIDQVIDSVRAETSVETTIVPNGNIGDEYWTIPAQVSLRAAGAGVSPIVAMGSGRLTEKSDVNVDFSLHSATNGSSVFGEREEYRFGLRNKHVGLRVGDNSFGFSMLTSSGSQSTGAELRAQNEKLTGGAYVNRNRWTPNAATEMAAMIGTNSAAQTSGSLILMERGRAGLSSQIAAGTAKTSFRGANFEFEGAASDSNRNGGSAAIVRMFGTTRGLAYDLGGQHGSDAFAGSQRAQTDEHVSVSGQKVGSAVLSAMASVHNLNPTKTSNGFGQHIGTAMVTANWSNGTAIELQRLDRADIGSSTSVRGHQQSVRVRGHHEFGRFDLGADLQEGIVAQADSASHGFQSLNLSGRAEVAKDQFVSLFTDIGDGRSLGAGGVGNITTGGNIDLHIGARTTVRATASMTAQRNRMSDWVGQTDISIEEQVRQSIVALRTRISQSGSKAIPGSNAVYLEVRTPLHLPTSRLDLGGRAQAQVVDAETGRGIEGALVRMGEHAAITDKQGNAYFKGLEMGEYHAVVDGGPAAGRLVIGENTVAVKSSRVPASLMLKLARGARVAARIHRYERNAAAAPNAVDSLVDMGAVNSTVLALVSGKDTIWQTSDDKGRVDFGSVAPGRYTVAVVAGDVPEFMAFENKEVSVDVASGDERQVEIRMVPVNRPVEFMASETVLVAAPTKTAPATSKPMPRPAPTPRGQKNNNN